MHNAGFAAAVNFQPAGSSVPDGYVADAGAAYGLKSSGLFYGWNTSKSSDTRDRNSSLSPDQRYDTLIRFDGPDRWEMAVENGPYEVHLVAGDPEGWSSNYKIAVEGVLGLSGTPTGSKRWIESTITVNVADGKVSITSADGAWRNRLAFLEISAIDDGDSSDSVSEGTTATSTPSAPSGFLATANSSSTIRLTWRDNSSNESGFKIERKKGDNGTWGQIATAGANAVSFNDSGLPSGTRYVYRVRAYNSAGNSAYSNSDGSTTYSGSTSSSSGSTISSISWSTRASAPVPLDDSMGVACNGKLYVLGGMNSSGPVLRADVYNPSTNTWSRLPNPPERTTHAQPVVDGQYIYLVGGYVGTGNGWEQVWATRHVWRFDTSSQKWSSMPQLPVARGGGAAVRLGREIHFFGGVDVNRVDKADHFVLNLDNLSAGWKTAASVPNARSHLAGAVINGKIYAIGGQHGYDGNATLQSTVNVFDPATGKWSYAASLPRPTSHIICSTFTYNGRIIVIGGDINSPGQRSSDILSYNPGSNSWTYLKDLPSARMACVAGAINGAFYVTVGSSQTTTWKGTLG